jgi:hypothetical protein
VSTRVKSDMRGLVTAGRDFRVGVDRRSSVERHQLCCNVIAHSQVAGHSKTLAATSELMSSGQLWVLAVEDGQRPAPASEFAGDRRVGDHGAFLALIEAHPPVVQTPIRGLTPGAGGRGRRIPAAPQRRARPIRGPVMPGRFDEQSAGVAVAGLGDPTLGAGRPRGVLGGHQPEVGADRAAGQPVPVADLGGQRERGQRRDSAQAPQPPHHRCER